MNNPVIGVVGLGKLGVCLAAVLSDVGYEVWGADKSEALVTAVTNGEPPNAWEPGLTALVQEWCMSAPKPGPFGYAAGNVSVAGTDTAAMAERCDVVFIVVPTPSLPSGEFDDSMVREAVAEVCAGLVRRERGVPRWTDGLPLVVLTSTLHPGSCDAIRAEMDENGWDAVHLAYSPAFIALGSVVKDLRTADMWLIGTAEPGAARTLSAIYERMTPDAQQRTMSMVGTEITKLAVNVQLSIRISFANTVARMCERFPGANATNVLDAIGSDGRIGHGFLRHGGTPSGDCLPRDIEAWASIPINADADFAAVVRASTADTIDWVMDQVHAALALLVDEPRGYADVAVWGLTFKSGVPSYTRSLGVAVCQALHYEGVDYCAHDPLVMPDPKAWCELADALTCPIVVCCSEVPQELAVTSQSTVVDVWSCVTIPENRENVQVIRPGVHHVPRR